MVSTAADADIAERSRTDWWGIAFASEVWIALVVCRTSVGDMIAYQGPVLGYPCWVASVGARLDFGRGYMADDLAVKSSSGFV
jgi:hypothetical protein